MSNGILDQHRGQLGSAPQKSHSSRSWEFSNSCSKWLRMGVPFLRMMQSSEPRSKMDGVT